MKSMHALHSRAAHLVSVAIECAAGFRLRSEFPSLFFAEADLLKNPDRYLPNTTLEEFLVLQVRPAAHSMKFSVQERFL